MSIVEMLYPIKEIILLLVLLIFFVLLANVIAILMPKKRRRRKAKKEKHNRPRPTKGRKLTDEEIIKANIDTLSGEDFERLMQLYYQHKGYTVTRTGGSGDHEVDLILSGGKEGYKIAVQCKRWKQNVGNDIVLRLKAGKQIYGCIDAWIVTTSDFTAKAKEAAEKFNIRLINGLSIRYSLHDWKKKLRV